MGVVLVLELVLLSGMFMAKRCLDLGVNPEMADNFLLGEINGCCE